MQRTLHLLVFFIFFVLCEIAQLKRIKLLCDLFCPTTVHELSQLQRGSAKSIATVRATTQLGRSSKRSIAVNSVQQFYTTGKVTGKKGLRGGGNHNEPPHTDTQNSYMGNPRTISRFLLGNTRQIIMFLSAFSTSPIIQLSPLQGFNYPLCKMQIYLLSFTFQSKN